jgi:hypothetical protein
MAVKELHLLGIYCIDLKPDNIRVSLRNWAVCIIDCDGMSVIDIASPTGKRFHEGPNGDLVLAFSASPSEGRGAVSRTAG